MNIALLGYGNMGREIETLVSEGGKHKIVSVSYKDGIKPFDTEGLKRADVAIDFTSAEIVMDNIKIAADLGKNIVVGTTGWYDRLDEAKHIVEERGTGLVYGSNFSIGANLFFRIADLSAALIARASGYTVRGSETHHTRKKDKPSGTAKKLAEIIGKSFPHGVSFESIREGDNPGLHEVFFESEADEIRLTHQAHGRRGFAEGALVAAECIKNRKGVYSFEEVLDLGH